MSSSTFAVGFLAAGAMTMAAMSVRAATRDWSRVEPPPPAPTVVAHRDPIEREAVEVAARQVPDLEAQRRKIVAIYLWRKQLEAQMR